MLATYTYILKKKIHFVDTLSRRIYFWDTAAVPCGFEKGQDEVQLNPNENKFDFLTPYRILMTPLKKFSPESMKFEHRLTINKFLFQIR